MNATFEILPGITSISNLFKGILLDAYGVFWNGNDSGLLPGSKEAMEKLVLSGKIVGILSNSTQLGAKEISKLNSHGLVLGQHFHFLVTSGDVGRSVFLNKSAPFKTTGNKFFLFGGVHPKFSSHKAIFEGSIYHEVPHLDLADFVYLSVPHILGEDQEHPEVFLEEVKKLKVKNLPMICPNPDLFAHEGNPARAVVRQGSIARMYEEMGGEVFYIGKPHKDAYLAAMDQFKAYGLVSASEILMVGDTPETDIRGARSFGMVSALITQTGIMADRIRLKGLGSAISELSSCNFPNYFIERFKDDVCPAS